MDDKTPCTDMTCTHSTDDDWRKCVTDQLRVGHDRMTKIETDVVQIKSDTSELVEILKAVKGGLKVLQALGLVIKWGAGVAVGIGSVLALFQGKWPGK